MASDIRTIKAGCLCGSAAHKITLPAHDYPLKAYICHCSSCRHATGTLCLTIVFLPKEYRLDLALIDKLQSFKFSKRITQYHCPICGTQMLARCLEDEGNSESPVVWGTTTGSLEQAEGLFEVAGHEHIEDTLDGGFSDFLPTIKHNSVERWPGHFREGAQLPLYWPASMSPKRKAPSSTRLHARCKCGGVNFWISPPSQQSFYCKAPWPDVLIPFNAPAETPRPDQPWWLRDRDQKFLAGVCSCNSCRLASGMEWMQWAFVPTVNMTLDVAGQIPFKRRFGTLQQYPSSDDVTRHFCGTCGATVFWDGAMRPDLIDVAVGLLDAAEGARAEGWLEWTTKRLSYREDAIPRAASLTLAVEAGLTAYGEHTRPGDSNSPSI